MIKAKINLVNIIAYLQGNYRYYIYYEPNLKFLMRKYIRDQIDYRITVMDKDCFNSGSCKLCGCTTTKLQMADKACDKPCYPKMMDEKQWSNFKGELSKAIRYFKV